MIKNHLKLSRRISLGIMLAALSIGSTSWAATYYVDPNGNDTSGNGASTSPWKSLSVACSKVGSGNTIYINAGTYTDNNRCNLATGVTIQGAGASKVTITSAYAGGYTTGYIYRSTGSANPVAHGNNDISGFTLDGSNKTLSAGIWLDGTDNITIHDMTLQHIHSTAVRVGAWNGWADYNSSVTVPPAAYGLNVSIHDLVINDCTSMTTSTTNDRVGAIDLKALDGAQLYNINLNENYPNHGTGLKNVQGWLKGIKFHDSTFNMDHGNTDSFVIETYNFLGDAEIYNNNFNSYISFNGGLQTPLAGSTWNLKVHDNVFNMTGLAGSGHEFSHNWLNIYNNYFYGAGAPAAGLWSTNYLTSGGVAHWRFNNNVVYNCSDGVYMARGANSYIEIFNNTFDTMTASPWGGSGIDGSAFSGTMSGTKIQNNLIMNSKGTPISTSSGMTSSVISNNWLNTAGPGITATGNRPSPYYMPNGPSSNLADAGVNVGLPYSGTAPAIGAYEPNKALNPPSGLTVY
jgi:hypothetical protein